MKKSHWIIIILIALFLIAYSERPEIDFASVRVDEPDVWPTEEWPISTPEEQGVDSEKLIELFDFLDNHPRRYDGLLIIKNGNIIAEKYNFPYGVDFPHQIYSVTKSLTSAATGVAIEEGLISLNDKVLDFFPDKAFENMSKEKENMTVEQLLTMTNGVDWPEWDGGMEFWVDWYKSDQQLKYYLDRPIIKEQIGKFNYDTGSSVAMAAIIEKATGMKLSDYAQEMIFNKIGVKSLEWRPTKEGITNGGTYALMTPRDMARFGFLYLHEGKWDGEQIIPKEWVKTSTSPHTGEEWQGYGYYFWLTKAKDTEIYYAAGSGRQYIFIIPEENLVVVYTASGHYKEGMLTNYILPAIKSDKPLPENEEAYIRLKEIMEE